MSASWQGLCMERPPSSGRCRSPGLWKYWFGLELLYVLASEERVLQRRNRLFCFNVSRAQTQGLEGVLWYVYPQPDDRASSEVDDGVDGDHFQVQLNSTGPLHGAGHHQRSTDGSRLLCTRQEEAGGILKSSSWKTVISGETTGHGLWAAKVTVFCCIVRSYCNSRESELHFSIWLCFSVLYELSPSTVCKAFGSLHIKAANVHRNLLLSKWKKMKT